MPLERLGVDSLLATELAVAFHRTLGADLPTLEILSSHRIADLVTRLIPALDTHAPDAPARS